MTNEEHDFLVWLRTVQKRAILPLKWAILVTAITFWILSHPGQLPPSVDVFALFTLYLMYNAGESYFFWLSRVSLSQVWHFCIVSYFVDIAFVTILIYLDVCRYPAVSGAATDFYLFYFLLILRGFAIFRTTRGNLMANIAVGMLFILSVLWQDTDLSSYSARNSLIRVVFMWLVILMSWFIVEIINRQKVEIMRAREHVLQSDNMAVLGEIAAGVAHEINNPIGIISAYAEFLNKNAAPDDARREDFQTIYKEARRCQNIVMELLDYARPVARTKTMLDLRELCDEVLSFLFRRTQRAEVRIEKQYDQNVPLIPLDQNQMKQALLNIFINAREAMRDAEGLLRISIETDLDRNTVALIVEDNGVGMDADQVKRAFDPFFTTRPRGTGLGLSITRRIVENHGGKLGLKSVKGKGTTVKITIPYEHTAIA